jgi:hypothetical protein
MMFTIIVSGTKYHIKAGGRARACEQAVRMHTGYAGKLSILFARYAVGSVIYTALTADGTAYEIQVIQ